MPNHLHLRRYTFLKGDLCVTYGQERRHVNMPHDVRLIKWPVRLSMISLLYITCIS